MKKALIFFADGFEECEGLLVVDLLRRAGIDISTVAVGPSKNVRSSHGVTIEADQLLSEIDPDGADVVILPGGIPGTPNLLADETVQTICRAYAADKDKAVCAVCAAPSVLGQLGLLRGKKATVYPGFEDKLLGAEVTGEPVTKDGNIITACGLGASIPFALEIIRLMKDAETAKSVADKIQYHQ